MDANHPFAALAGSWQGHGEGSYPTITSFAYSEHLLVSPVPGKPLANWWSRTRDAYSGDARHSEAGFLRATPTGIELVVAHAFGVVETSTGSLVRGDLTLSTYAICGTPTAKRIDVIERQYGFARDTLQYTVSMAASGLPVTHHLRAVLLRSKA